jgi:hypothetical protein
MTTIIDVHTISPSINVYIKHFIKQMNIPIKFEIISNDMTGGGGTDTGNSNYFQSFLQFFSQEKQKEQTDKTYLNSLFYSGEGSSSSTKKKEPIIETESKPITTPITFYKIKLTTPNHPDINLQTRLKGTKFDYLLERNKNKDLKLLWI